MRKKCVEKECKNDGAMEKEKVQIEGRVTLTVRQIYGHKKGGKKGRNKTEKLKENEKHCCHSTIFNSRFEKTCYSRFREHRQKQFSPMWPKYTHFMETKKERLFWKRILFIKRHEKLYCKIMEVFRKGSNW